MLGETLAQQGRYKEARDLLLRSHASIVGAVGDSNWMALESLMRVVKLFDDAGQEEEARSYRDTVAEAGLTSGYAPQWTILRHAFGPEHQKLRDLGDRFNELCGAISYVASPPPARAACYCARALV